MKTLLPLLGLVVIPSLIFGDEPNSPRRFVTNDRLTLGREAELSASVRVADFNGDEIPDIVVANGRHWPGQNAVFLNSGSGRFNVRRNVGLDQSTSYATEPVDVDGDGDIDIIAGNDMAKNQIMLNDGQGGFTSGLPIGSASSLRSMTVADIDADGDSDVLITCRGRANQICLNNGKGTFKEAGTFGTKRDSTIDVAVLDWNADGHPDLVLANRDSQPNSILLNDGKLGFTQSIPFGTKREQTRAVAIADMNGDGHPDIVAGNIGQPNRIYLADGKAGFAETIDIGRADGRSYSVSVADMDNDGDMDVVVGNVAQQNAVFFNQGDGKTFQEVRFGDEAHATYSVDTGDLDGDGFCDVVAANSGAMNFVFLNRPATPVKGRAAAKPETAMKPPLVVKGPAAVKAASDQSTTLDFRGTGGARVADGFALRSAWDVADPIDGGILWSVDVPGLAHSSPVIKGDRIYLTTAVAAEGDAPLKVGRGGRPDAADDNGEQSWIVLCYDRKTGRELWRQTARTGKPKVTRHVKATHANTSVAIDGDNVVAFFGSEGIYCYDLDGNQKWSRDLGVINISKYGIGWGYASSPAISDDRIVIVCDDPDNPFVAALKLSDGEEIWRTSRTDICVRSWSTPFVHNSNTRTQAVINGWPWIVSYDTDTGKELWRIKGGGDNPVPTPFEANGWIYITSAHGAEAPIFVVKPDANGDITPPPDTGSNESVVWSTRRDGSYMSTPVVYDGHLYLGNTNGVLRCYDARTGEKVYEERLGTGASIYASLVAADGKIFCASENGDVYVVAAGSEFEVLAKNEMGEAVFATPTIAEGILYLRTTKKLIAVK